MQNIWKFKGTFGAVGDVHGVSLIFTTEVPVYVCNKQYILLNTYFLPRVTWGLTMAASYCSVFQRTLV